MAIVLDYECLEMFNSHQCINMYSLFFANFIFKEEFRLHWLKLGKHHIFVVWKRIGLYQTLKKPSKLLWWKVCQWWRLEMGWEKEMGAATVTIAVDTLTDCLRARAGCSYFTLYLWHFYMFFYMFTCFYMFTLIDCLRARELAATMFIYFWFNIYIFL